MNPMQVVGKRFARKNGGDDVEVEAISLAKFKGNIELSGEPAHVREVLNWVEKIAPDMLLISISHCGDWTRSWEQLTGDPYEDF